MAEGMEALFQNAATFYSLMISISYFNTVLLFVLFFLVLHVARKFIKS